MTRHFLFCLSLVFTLRLAAGADESVNYEEHIKPIFRQHCLSCHGDDKEKADLNLQSYATTLKGGSGGVAVVAGRSSQSLLFKSITDPDDDARMPPKKPAIPAEQLAMIQKWIDSGLRESSGSKSLVAERDLSFKPVASANVKPATPAMPGSWPEVKLPPMKRPLPVLTLDVSPWAPLAAVAGLDHVRLMNLDTQLEMGHLPFPEGEPHMLRFSRDGALLMVAGGRPVELGKVVLFDVVTGKRLTAIGDEVDSVLAADLSPDQKSVVLGGAGKVVKVYDTTSGKLRYKIDKHTDWIMAVAFSPDGKLLASADRAGGLHLWEAASGRALLSLSEHKASIRALDWRADSKLLASAGEDGLIVWWDVKDGWPAISKANAHPPARAPGSYGKVANGVLAARFDHEGRLCTAGRDHTIRLWDTKGIEIKSFPVKDAQPLCAALSHDGKKIIGGDTAGQVHFWTLEPAKK
jgi:WD40 repeat protein